MVTLPPLTLFLRRLEIDFHFYEDDTQIYVKLPPSSFGDTTSVIANAHNVMVFNPLTILITCEIPGPISRRIRKVNHANLFTQLLLQKIKHNKILKM